MSVVVLLLASGQEIIGSTDARTSGQYSTADELDVNNTITLAKVRVVAPMQTPDGRIQVSLMPYVFSNIDTDVNIAVAHIVGVASQPSREMEREYLQQTTSIALT